MSRDHYVTRFTTTINPALDFRDKVPLAGELIYVTHTGEMRVGDGIRHFADLPLVVTRHSPDEFITHPECIWIEQEVAVNVDDLI